MENMVSYLCWRGDLTWREALFNEVDNLILACLSYYNFQGIVKEDKTEAISLKEAVDHFLQEGRESDVLMNVRLLKEAARSRRFKDIKLWGYVDIVDAAQEMTQFAAIHMILEKGLEYIAFRGTDNTIVGWREDFCLSFEIIPAQRKAVEYLEKTVEKDGKTKYIIGGHSKGGNLAVYSSMICSDQIKKNILSIYANDSPGICPAMMDLGNYRKIEERIHRIVPEFCIIGMLFDCDSNSNAIQKSRIQVSPQRKTVKSSADGVLQHDPLSWQVECDHFIKADQISERAQKYNEIFDHWIESADLEQRRTFVKSFFDALETGGAKMMNDVLCGGTDRFEAILFAMAGADRNAKRAVGKLMISFWEEMKKVDFRKLFREGKMTRGTAAILTGALFTIAPGIALNILGTAFCLWLLIFSLLHIQRLISETKPWQAKDRMKLLLYSGIAFLEIFSILFNRIVVLSTNLILAVFLIWRAWHQAKNGFKMKAARKRWWFLPVMESVFAWVLTLVVLGKAGQGMENYILAAGAYLTLGGMGTIGKVMLDEIGSKN